MMQFATFSALVQCATATPDSPGIKPYPYQQRIADDGLPDLVEVPTGSGKTMAVALTWLWRLLFHPEPATRQATPRRLVFALPTRALTSQTEATVMSWLSNLKLDEAVGVHVLMGGRNDHHTQNSWRIELHRPTIVICTLDMLVSRCLLRGYGSTRGAYPLDFALMTNGSHIVVDEMQLVPQATATLRQLSAFQRSLGTAEPHGLTIMSATVDTRILSTVDNPFPGLTARVIGLSDADLTSHLARRLSATRTIRQLPAPTTYKDLAVQVIQRHAPGTLTLVVLNTVDAAKETYRHLRKQLPDEPSLLIHSRFRGVERQEQLTRLERISTSGGIVISTQSIEAGVDIDALTLITEAAPWPSVVQRAGRCNRAGRYGDATLWWCPPDKPLPYAESQVDAAAERLRSAEGRALTSAGLQQLGSDIQPEDLALRLLRRRDFDQLFDTTPDLGGSDLDIGVYIRTDQDLDVQLAWVPDGSLSDPNVTLPSERLRCPVSITNAGAFVKRETTKAWVFRPQDDRWVPARGNRLRPQDVVLVEASSGGYSPELGFEPTSRVSVILSSSTEFDQAARIPDAPSASQEPGAVAAGWVSIHQHLDDTRDQAQALVSALAPTGISADALATVIAAAALHDIGKAHMDWNRALKEANPGETPPDPQVLYAKSPGNRPLRVSREITVTTRHGQHTYREDRVGFRHELVSVAMLSTAAAETIMSGMGIEPGLHPLVTYLIGAHHGHLRVSARDPRYDGRDGRTLLGCVDEEDTPSFDVLGGHLPASTIDLTRFRGAGEGSWTAQALDLRERFGPFRLAWLETLVRMADWRASADRPLAGEQ